MANYYKLEMLSNVLRHAKPQRTATTSLLDNEVGVFGRDDIRDEIANVLTSRDPLNDDEFGIRLSSEKIPIVTICGMGGIGKTTLAQMLCNYESVKSYFKDNIIWVCVSDEFDEYRIISEILKKREENSKNDSLDVTSCKSLDVLKKYLVEVLQRERYLLVLDDVWNEDLEKWQRLAKHFRIVNGNEGSKVLATTRNMKIAEIMSPQKLIWKLDCLPDKTIKSLFAKIIFNGASSSFDDHPELNGIGDKIINKLKGSPLAAITVGRVLRLNISFEFWKSVSESDIWEVNQDESGIMPALWISYHHLPEYLKPCFAFCSLFPKDYEYHKTKIIEMWIALGFVRQKHRGILMEDTGRDYVNELLISSMFQPCKDDDECFIIHDLIHDLATMVAAGDMLMVKSDNDMEKLSSTIRHLSVFVNDISGTGWDTLNCFKRLTNIRTMIISHKFGVLDACPNIVEKVNVFAKRQVSNMKCLRILDIHCYKLKEVPVSFSKIKHLRYLNLSKTGITALPSSVRYLHQLQVLHVLDPFKQLPTSLKNLTSLRHVYRKHFTLDTADIMGSSLIQELVFMVTWNNGLKVLQEKKWIRYLEIHNLEKVRHEKEAMDVQLKSMVHLKVLQLKWYGTSKTNNEEKIIEALEPNPNIRSLMITSKRTPLKCPSWLENSSLALLETLVLEGLYISEVSPPLNKFPNLKNLQMHHADGKNSISSEPTTSGHTLDARGPRSLSSSLSGDRWLPTTLEHLTIGGCDILESVHLSKLTLLKELTLFNCRCIQSIPREVLGAIKGLDATKCENLVLYELETLTCLESLSIRKCPKIKLEVVQDLMPPSLQLLTLNAFTNFTNLRINNPAVPALQSFSPSQQELQSLQRLLYLRLEDMGPDRIKDLLLFLRGNKSLRTICISECENLTSFDEETQDALCGLVSLSKLVLNGLLNLQALPERLCDVSSLSDLVIHGCPKLQRLPQLPVHLLMLNIWNCPRLKKRYKRGRFTLERKEIAHVPILMGEL